MRTLLSLAVLFLTVSDIIVEEAVTNTFPADNSLTPNSSAIKPKDSTYLSPGRLL
jgi:hypothetical protein